MSASIIPVVGPAMICASSSTRRPASGPGCGGRSGAGCFAVIASASDEAGLLLGQEGRVADAEVLGVEAVEALVDLLRRERPALGEAPRELLVPAGDERRAFGDALRGRRALRRRPGRPARSRVTSPLSFASAASKTRPSSRISSATARPTSRTSGAISAYAITRPEVLDRRAEAARRAADAQVGTARRSRARRRRRCRGSARRSASGSAASFSAVECITLPYSIACALFERCVSNSPMSLPGENAFSPAPRRMMQRTPVVAATALDTVRPVRPTSRG